MKNIFSYMVLVELSILATELSGDRIYIKDFFFNFALVDGDGGMQINRIEFTNHGYERKLRFSWMIK